MFTERFNELLSDVCRTTTGEFAKITKYDRSYVSHLRIGDRIPSPGRPAAGRLARAVCVCAAEKGVSDELRRRVGAPKDAGDEALCAAVEAWLFGAPGAGRVRRRGPGSGAPEGRRRGNFGERLGLAMDLADVSSLRLARSLNVDASLIAKYRSGLRVPSMNHPVIRDVGQVLAARICALDRIAALAQLMGCPREELAGEKTIARRLEAWLRDFSTVDTSLVETFLEKMDAFSADTKLTLPLPEDAVDPSVLEDSAGEYEGIAGLQRAVLRFLGAAVRDGQKELWLYSDQSIDWMVGERAFSVRWMALMSAYVRGGGKIRIIHNVDRGLEEMVSAILNWLPLYLSGGIESWYCLRQGGERFSHTLFLAPESACISAVYVAGKEQRCRYRYTVGPEGTAYYGALFRDLLAECHPLLTMSRGGMVSRLPGAMKDQTVHRVARSLSLATMPGPLLDGILARAGLPKQTAQEIRADWASLRELVEEKLRTGEIFECFALPEEAALFEGKTAVDTARADLFYTPEEFSEHVRAVLELFEREPNYHICPMQEAPFERIRLVLSNRMALIECPSGQSITFTATQPLACRALVDFARRLEQQYDADRLALKDRLKRYISYSRQADDRPQDRKEVSL